MYDKYIRSKGVIPFQDVARPIEVLQGSFEEIGVTPIPNIAKQLLKDPEEVLDYYGNPLERFPGEKKKYLGMPMTGQQKALLQNIPALSEIDKLIAGSYRVGQEPEAAVRGEQFVSPVGVSLQDPEANKFFRELEQKQKVSGKFQGGYKTLYKKNLKNFLESGMQDEASRDNTATLKALLLESGESAEDIAELKAKAIKEFKKDQKKAAQKSAIKQEVERRKKED